MKYTLNIESIENKRTYIKKVEAETEYRAIEKLHRFYIDHVSLEEGFTRGLLVNVNGNTYDIDNTDVNGIFKLR